VPIEGVDTISRERDKIGLLTWGILLGGALLLRAAFVASRAVLGGDEIHYAESLHRLMEGRILDGVSDYWSFLYPFVSLPFGLMYGDAESGLRLCSILCGSALVIPSVLIAFRLWGRKAALFAGVLVALHTNLIDFSTAAMTESLYALLLMFSLYLLVRCIQGAGHASLVLLGVMLSLAYQTRQEAQFITVLFVIVVLVGRGGAGLGGRLRLRIGRAAMLVLIFLVCSVPYSILMHRKTGEWTSGSKAAVNLSSPRIWEDGLDRERYVYGLNDDGIARKIDEIGDMSVFEVLWRRKGSIAAGYFQKLSRGFHLVPMLLTTPLLLLLVPLGLFGRRWSKSGRAVELVMLLVGVFPFVLYAVFLVQIRYLVPFLPIYLLWGARGCEVIGKWLRENVPQGAAVHTAVLLVVFASLIPFTINRFSVVRAGQRVEYREIGRWIRGNTDGDVKVLAHPGCPVSYYAGDPEASFIPWTDPEGLIHFARHHQYGYLVVDEGYFRTLRPQLVQFLENDPFPGVETLESFTGIDGGMIRVHKLSPQP
jgi:hypothetical protein